MPDDLPKEKVEALLNAVDDSYRHFDEEKELVERSLQLSSEELIEKNKELLEKNEMLEAFVYRVTHDLKSPGHNMQNMARMLRSALKEENPMAEQIIGHLVNSSNALVERINDLLSVTRIRSNVMEEAVEINLPEMVSEVQESISNLIEDSGAQFNLDFETLRQIRFPKENLFSIFLNIVSNSIKYRSPDRHPEIWLRGELTPEGEGILTFRDNGLGIDMERHGDKLFSMFARFHSHTEGSGVGLYIVKRIVEEAKGRIEVQSEPGKGTEFRIYLPNTAIYEKAASGIIS